MRTIQGVNFRTRLLHLMRQLRSDYVANQREGKHPKDTGQLAKFDATMEKIDANRRLPAKR